MRIVTRRATDISIRADSKAFRSNKISRYSMFFGTWSATPCRGNLVDQAQDWRWCSLWRKLNGDRESLLSSWPLDQPENWIDWVNRSQTDAEIEALRRSVNRGTPYGSENWKIEIAAALGLKYTLQPRGRPKKLIGLTNTQT